MEEGLILKTGIFTYMTLIKEFANSSLVLEAAIYA